mmetsp:Transcript_88710/g.138832  ORF Transcript_88710/g.138832 Transcript_88710/m.138832 type:complete len:248 (+) Transcript_88710:867-1610(+)
MARVARMPKGHAVPQIHRHPLSVLSHIRPTTAPAKAPLIKALSKQEMLPPRLAAGAISPKYMDSPTQTKPFPTPQRTRPAISIGKFEASPQLKPPMPLSTPEAIKRTLELVTKKDPQVPKKFPTQTEDTIHPCSNGPKAWSTGRPPTCTKLYRAALDAPVSKPKTEDVKAAKRQFLINVGVNVGAIGASEDTVSPVPPNNRPPYRSKKWSVLSASESDLLSLFPTETVFRSFLNVNDVENAAVRPRE